MWVLGARRLFNLLFYSHSAPNPVVAACWDAQCAQAGPVVSDAWPRMRPDDLVPVLPGVSGFPVASTPVSAYPDASLRYVETSLQQAVVANLIAGLPQPSAATYVGQEERETPPGELTPLLVIKPAAR